MMYWPVAKEISFKDVSIYLWWPCCSTELNILINFGRRHHKKHFFEIILNLDQLFRRRGHLKICLIYSSGGLFSVLLNHLCNNGRGPYAEHFCDTV